MIRYKNIQDVAIQLTYICKLLNIQWLTDICVFLLY